LRKREFCIEQKLKSTIKKLHKKDRDTYSALMRKIKEVVVCEDVDHYKNLRKPLQHLKRVHIKNSFVLTFKFDKHNNRILFYRFKHRKEIHS